MPAKRGRTITSFGQLFGSLSGGVSAVLVRLIDQEFNGEYDVGQDFDGEFDVAQEEYWVGEYHPTYDWEGST